MIVLHGTLVCCNPDCLRTVPATLIENSSGVIQVHQHMCGECLGIMIIEYDTEEADAYKKRKKILDNKERDENSG